MDEERKHSRWEDFELVHIDDDLIILIVTKMMVQELDDQISFESFSSATDALDYFNKSKDNQRRWLILLDLNMPGMSGWDFLRELAKGDYEKRCTVVIASSSVDPRDTDRANADALVKDFISKPLYDNKIQNVIEKYGPA